MNLLREEAVPTQVKQLAERMKKEIVVATMWLHFKRYPSVFVGSDVVRWMIRQKLAKTSEEAVRMGQRVLKAGFIQHVTRDKDFLDDHVLYHFVVNTSTSPHQPEPEPEQQQGAIPLTRIQVERAISAMLGAMVADAATCGMNGVSTGSAVHSLMMKTRQITPEFFNNLEEPHLPAGQNSALGYESSTLMRHLSHRGELNLNAYVSDVRNYYQNYDGELRPNARECLKKMEKDFVFPKCAVKSKEADFMAKVPFITARYAGTTELLSKVEQCVGVQQSNPEALTWAKTCALILEKIILGASVRDALKWAISPGSLDKKQASALLKVIRYGDLTASEAVSRFGKSSALPGAVQSCIQQLLNGTDFAELLRGNMMAGGESCIRSMFIGSCMAADIGIGRVPSDWISKTTSFNSLKQLSASIMNARAGANASPIRLFPVSPENKIRETIDLTHMLTSGNRKTEPNKKLDLTDVIAATKNRQTESNISTTDELDLSQAISAAKSTTQSPPRNTDRVAMYLKAAGKGEASQKPLSVA